MMRSLFSGVSGLKNHQTRMDVIGNNISNVNTTGFKSSRVNFTDMLSQTLSGASSPQENVGGTNPKQIGLGSAVGAIDLLFTNGSVQSTGVNTDLALSSTNSLFILDRSGNNDKVYTRNGDFQFDAEGYYVQAGTGYFVQGWTAVGDEPLRTDSLPGKIQIKAGKTMEPKASSLATYSNNLNAEVPTIKSISGGTPGSETKTYDTDTGGSVTASATSKVKITCGTTIINNVESGTYTIGDDYEVSTGVFAKITGLEQTVPNAKASADNAVTLTLSDGSKVTQTSGTYEVGHSLPVVTTLTLYDTLGSKHEVPVYFTKTNSEADAWSVSLSTETTTPGVPSEVILEESDGTKTTVTMNVVALDFNEYGAQESGSGVATLTLKNGSESPSTVSISFDQLTQYTASNTIAGKANGNTSGSLSSISIDKSGIITGTYTNGEKRQEAQVAVAQFTNPGGLTKVGESLYEQSNNSGEANIKTAAALGATITPAALEMSNVDIANEFTDMIVTQRGFQGNSKIITVSDEMLETLINMKR